MEHPITPSPELVKQWIDMWYAANNKDSFSVYIATQAARWGADRELEACAQWVEANFGQLPTHNLHQFRRPKPPSLKEQALKALGYLQEDEPNYQSSFDVIRRALEALPND